MAKNMGCGHHPATTPHPLYFRFMALQSIGQRLLLLPRISPQIAQTAAGLVLEEEDDGHERDEWRPESIFQPDSGHHLLFNSRPFVFSRTKLGRYPESTPNCMTRQKWQKRRVGREGVGWCWGNEFRCKLCLLFLVLVPRFVFVSMLERAFA